MISENLKELLGHIKGKQQIYVVIHRNTKYYILAESLDGAVFIFVKERLKIKAGLVSQSDLIKAFNSSEPEPEAPEEPTEEGAEEEELPEKD